MELGIHHEFLLCALNDMHGTWSVKGFKASFALAGALVAEMQHRERLVAVKANTFALRSGAMSTGALGMAEGRLEGRQLSMKKTIAAVNTYWFSGVGQIRVAALDELHRAGLVRKEQDTFLFIPWRLRYPEVDGEEEERIRARLRRHIATAGDGDAPGRDDLLLSILRTTKLLDGIWSEAELERLKPAIDERTRRAPIGVLIRDLARESEAAAAAAATAYTCAAAFQDFED